MFRNKDEVKCFGEIKTEKIYFQHIVTKRNAKESPAGMRKNIP